MEKHPHLWWEAINNNTVDKFANTTRFSFFHKQHVHLSGVLVKRAENYAKFLKHEHNIIFRMHVQLQTMRATPAAGQMSAAFVTPTNIVHKCPITLHDIPPVPLIFEIGRTEFDQYVADQPSAIKGFSKLLTHCTFPCNDSSSGLTWHELFVIPGSISHDFFIFQKTSAVAAKSMFQQVREFASSSIALVKACLSLDSQRHLQTSTAGADRLLSYGHVRRLPHTKLAPFSNEDVFKALDLAMLQMDKVLSTAQQASYYNNTLVLKPLRFQGLWEFQMFCSRSQNH